ncbi:hypothetical protein [Amycolatopsis vancoresmycina]|uniref:hypothetical protein n=1 Tax=Amycolatopsis vancoresmycina TaxID=208444 RepID=UPI00039B13BA|nr:hypothetical protein [Amycolatopsis vancoresmycina]
MRNIVNSMLPSPGRVWTLNTAFANVVPSVFRIGDTYDGGTGLGGFGMPDRPPYVQFAFVCVCVAVHVTVYVDSFTLGPPAGTKADSSKFFPAAVEVAEVVVVVHDDVPPPNVMPGRDTASAVAVVGPSIEHAACGGIATFVNDAEPMFATPGFGSAAAGNAAKPVTTTAMTIALRIQCPPRPAERCRTAAPPRLDIRPPETSVAPGISDHPFEDREPPGAVSCSSPFPLDSG